MTTLTCITNQLDLNAGTRLDDNFKSSGKTKQAKATASNSIGIAIDEISYISPLWTYKLLTLISIIMIIGELFAFIN